jgi:uncharacterized protein (UPF0548 family)
VPDQPTGRLTGAAADRLRTAALNYPEVGRTAGELPDGYHHLRRTVRLGSGPRVFREATAALMSWQLHLRAGLEVSTSGPVAAGNEVLMRASIGPLRFTVPCRVIYVIDEPSRRGFGYGTLAGHQESGEESFIISHDEQGGVNLSITAFSRPATLLARAAGPVGRAMQHEITGRYLRALSQTTPVARRNR